MSKENENTVGSEAAMQDEGSCGLVATTLGRTESHQPQNLNFKECEMFA